MVESDKLRYTKRALNNGFGAIPVLGFGTLIPDPIATRTATKAALEAGFRQFDASERYRNEKKVGEAMQEMFKPAMGSFGLLQKEASKPRATGLPWHLDDRILVMPKINPTTASTSIHRSAS